MMLFGVLPLLSYLVSIHTVGAQEVTLTGTTLVVDGVYYYVPPEPIDGAQHEPPNAPQITSYTPVTVTGSFNQSSHDYDHAELEAIRKKYLDNDDVFTDSFFRVLYIQRPKAANDVTAAPIRVGNTTIVNISAASQNTIIPNGPYFLSSTGYLHQAYRLYSDYQGAFTEATIQSQRSKRHCVLPAKLPDSHLTIAVPSRLYYTKTAEKPLAGVRLGVKDIFDIAGVKTSLGNRAWEQLYPEANETATAVKNLVDAGAIVVGKMKTSQFAIGETATADWVDLHAPFNPRGDGYQDPSSSSAGPAAGIASYEWLDIALGSDTGGSIRSPSQVNGIFGNRPSHGLVSLDHTMPIAPELDTAGILTRDPELWHTAAKALYGHTMNSSCTNFPKSILTLDFPTTLNSTSALAITDFSNRVAEFLAGGNTTSTSITPLNLTSIWQTSNPNLPPLNTYFNSTYDLITSIRQADLVQKPFFADYAALHSQRTPFINPSVQARWTGAADPSSSSSSLSQVQTELSKITFFTSWLNTHILPASSSCACSQHLLIYFRGAPQPKYRNTYLPGVTPPSSGFSPSRLAVFGRVPDFVIPVGEVTYFSTITGKQEVLPLSVNFVARRGCDGMLFGLVRALLEEGVVRRVRVGRSWVGGGGILR